MANSNQWRMNGVSLGLILLLSLWTRILKWVGMIHPLSQERGQEIMLQEQVVTALL